MRSLASNTSAKLDKDINELIREFERTQIRQNELLGLLKTKIRQKDKIVTAERVEEDQFRENTKEITSVSVPELPYNPSFQPRIGDEVRIINPRKGQKNRGVVQSFGTDGKVRVNVGAKHKPIDRLWKNLTCTKRKS